MKAPESVTVSGERRTVVLGLLGLGTVGSQVYEALTQNLEILGEKTGFDYHVKKILVREPDKTREVRVPKGAVTTSPRDILSDPEIHLVVEMMGGIDPAASYIEQALQEKKSVVTSNKAVMATHGEKLLGLAADCGVDLFFEASVAGAIPVLRPVQESLATDRVLEVEGIVNGTTNYILSQMTRHGATYEKALGEAQKLGYAEPDPAFDVTGLDAAYKLAILSSLAFGYFARGEEVRREGIAGILPEDIRHAEDLGYRIKLLASARRQGESLSLLVAPTLVPNRHPLYNVEGPYNAILVKGERFGDIMFYGQGAGGVPTSTAIVSDIVQASKNLALGTGGKSVPKKDSRVKLLAADLIRSRFYLRLEVEDKPGTLAALAQVFASHEVSFSAVLQKENTSSTADIVFVTHVTTEGAFQAALEEVKRMAFVKGVQSILRVR